MEKNGKYHIRKKKKLSNNIIIVTNDEDLTWSYFFIFVYGGDL